MTTPIESPRPAKLWKSLPEERRFAAATAFWADEQAFAEQAEVVAAIAKQIKFRPKSVLALPVERKARLLARMIQVSDAVAGRLLVSYHLAHQRPMMKTFLDAAGVPNEDGLLGEDLQPPDREKLAASARQLLESFPAEDVRLYFSTLLLQDPDTWGPVGEALGTDNPAGAPTDAQD